MENLEQAITEIRERNKRVEADKAWETSIMRAVTIMVMTYIVTAVVMVLLKLSQPFFNALVATLGYCISAQSLPFIKKWWIKRYCNKD